MTHDLNDTLIFVKVVEHGSFVGAAKALQVPKTTVSRKVQELELRLGAQMIQRTTRKIGLTEAGKVYFEHAQRVVQELQDAESAVGQLQGGPRGWLRITAPYTIGVTWIAPLLSEFHLRYPEVRVEMLLSNDALDMISEGIDVALRGGNLPDSNLSARRLSAFRTQVYASPKYLERYGEPLHPNDLQHHRALAMQKQRRNGGSYIWTLNDGHSDHDFVVDPILVANDPAALTGALLSGEALILTADVTMKAFAELGLVRRVLTGWHGATWDFNAVFRRGQVLSPKVRAFVDFMVERLNFDADYMKVLCPDARAEHANNQLIEAIASSSNVVPIAASAVA